MRRARVLTAAAHGAAVLAALIPASTGLGQGSGHWTDSGQHGPVARANHGLAYDTVRHETILFGGNGGSGGTLADTWVWDGSQWRLLIEQGPFARTNAPLAFDSQRGVAVLFGGFTSGSGMQGDTWEWNGQMWTQVATTGPSARRGHSLAYDSRRGVTVLYGAESGLAARETWEWDGSEWMLRTSEGPGFRKNPGMAYDERRGVVVFFGGIDNQLRVHRDTWEWDGQTWTQVAATGPVPRESPGLVYDRHRGRILMHSGHSSGTRRTDTWEWDGTTWTELIADAPYARASGGMAYDSERDETILFGGWDGEYFDDTWRWRYDFWIETQPRDSAVGLGRRASFSVEVTGEPVDYQWRRDGVPLEDFGTISGSHSAELTISRVAANDAGLYDCAISQQGSEPITSRRAALAVVDPALNVDASCPGGGVISIAWEGTAPEGEVVLVFALRPGSMRVPSGHPCAGTQLGIDPARARVIARTNSDANGQGWLAGEAGPLACGAVMQLIDLSTCATSSVEVIE